MGEHVRLCGSATEVGRRLGEVQKDLIRAELDRWWSEDKVSAKRTARLRTILEDAAPWWLEENAALAEAAGVDGDRILNLVAAAYSPPAYYNPGACTSAIAMGDVTATGRPIVFKIRDEKPKPQYAAIRRIDGTKKVLYGVNVLNMGAAYAMNDAGLAIANNTGSPITDADDAPGLDDCMLTRLLAETCADCTEALARVQELCGAGFLRGAGYRKGAILILADAAGQGLLIEIARREFASRWLDGGYVVAANHFQLPESRAFEDASRLEEDPCVSSRVRHARLDQLIRERLQQGALRPADFEAFAADAANPPYSLCNPTDAFPWRTVGAFVFSLTQPPGVRFALGPPSSAAFADFDAAQDVSPQT